MTRSRLLALLVLPALSVPVLAGRGGTSAG
jgi:hypothetical protein